MVNINAEVLKVFHVRPAGKGPNAGEHRLQIVKYTGKYNLVSLEFKNFYKHRSTGELLPGKNKGMMLEELKVIEDNWDEIVSIMEMAESSLPRP